MDVDLVGYIEDYEQLDGSLQDTLIIVTPPPVDETNIEQMKGVDLMEINYEGGYEFGSERDYVEAQPMFQYWANVILFGNEEPQPLPDLPTLQTKEYDENAIIFN